MDAASADFDECFVGLSSDRGYAERRVRARLDRVDALAGIGAPEACLIGELRALAAEAAEWVEACSAGEDGPWSGVQVVAPGQVVGHGAPGESGRLAAARAVARLQATLEGGLRAM